MAEENPVTPVAAPEPPKANPLAAAGALPKTLKINPIVHKPVVGATQTGLKPGLRLPPKPGAMPTAALKPALKPGLKLPPKPVIHKPGTTVAAKPLPKPITPVPAAAAPAAAAPAPAAAAPAAPAPAASAPVHVDAQGVAKLPTVEAKVADIKAAAIPAAPKPLETLKSVTQKLKGITQQIPQQAILRKTGIIADSPMSDAQKQAAKSKTARISLSEAIGVAPVKNENAPMKTIRIKRPVNIPGKAPVAPAPIAATPAADPAAPATTEEKPAEGDASATITQRKTLKISRPGGVVRPTGKFGIKRPAAAPAAAAPADNPTGDVAPIADIADIPSIPDLPVVGASAATDDGPAWAWTLSSIVQVAASVLMGALAYFLWQNDITQYF